MVDIRNRPMRDTKKEEKEHVTRDALLYTVFGENAEFLDYFHGMTSPVMKTLALDVLEEISEGEKSYSALKRAVVARGHYKFRDEEFVRVLSKMAEKGFIVKRETVEKTPSSKADKKKVNTYYHINFRDLSSNHMLYKDVNDRFMFSTLIPKKLTGQETKREREILSGVASLDEVKNFLRDKYGEEDLFKVLNNAIEELRAQKDVEKIKDSNEFEQWFEQYGSRTYHNSLRAGALMWRKLRFPSSSS